MLEEAITFCQTNPSSAVKDIQFVVLPQDEALIIAFAEEIATLQSLHRVCPANTMGCKQLAGSVNVEVSLGNLCLETVDAIVIVNSKDLNMDSAGALSKAVKQAAGQGVQNECYQLGHQTGGSVVVTSGGNLKARHIIHLIPDSVDKKQLQKCVERCLEEAESQGFQSIAFAAVGTGGFQLTAADSASLIFQALNNFSAHFNFINKVRIVVFQAPILQAFQQEQRRHPLFCSESHVGITPPYASGQRKMTIEVINGDLTKEKSDAIMNIISSDMDLTNAGELSKAVLKAGGPHIQEECKQHGRQTAGTAVMTGGGSLEVRHIIHIIPGTVTN